MHVDADAFFAAVEQRDDPSLRGRPIAVGSPSARGVVLTASYEARPFGVRSAMPSHEAIRRCPELLFVPPRMDAYREAAVAMRAIFLSYTDRVEPLALDEAYLDVTEPERGPPSGTRIAQAIRAEVRRETGLSVSAGVSYVKFLAKIASDAAKPDGLRVVTPADAPALIETLPVRALPGVGPRAAATLAALGITTAGGLRRHDLDALRDRFGVRGERMWRLAHGEDDRVVDPDRPRKSVSAERTFDVDRVGLAELLPELPQVAADAARRAERNGVTGEVVVVKIKDARHRITTRQIRTGTPVRGAAEIHRVAERLLRERVPLHVPVRLLGIGLAGLSDGEVVQPPLFPAWWEAEGELAPRGR